MIIIMQIYIAHNCDTSSLYELNLIIKYSQNRKTTLRPGKLCITLPEISFLGVIHNLCNRGKKENNTIFWSFTVRSITMLLIQLNKTDSFLRRMSKIIDECNFLSIKHKYTGYNLTFKI